MESIKFFITHSFLLLLLLAFVSLLGGLAIVWWIWSKFEDQARESDRLLVAERERSAKLMREKQEWASSQSGFQRRISELEAALAGFSTDQSAWTETKARLELEIRDGRKLTETIENELSSCREERHQLIQAQRDTESRLEKTDQSLNALRQQLTVALNDREVLTKARTELQQQVTQAQAEMRSLRQQLDSISEARASAESNHSQLQGQINKLESELASSRPQLASLKQKVEELSQEREQHLQARQELETHQDRLEQEVVRLKTLAQSHAKEKEAATQTRADLESRLRQAEQTIAALHARPSPTQVASATPPPAPPTPQPSPTPAPAEPPPKTTKPTTKESDDILPLFAVSSRPDPTPTTTPAPSPVAAPASASPARPTQDHLRQDARLGWIYTSPPATRDDLGELWGVADVLVEKLNAAGVFTFRQIALWDDQVVEAFADRLDVFPERVRRDDWVNQAKDLHFRKYGERL